MADSAGPTHELKLIKELVFLGCYQVTGRAASDAGEMGFDESDILECVDARQWKARQFLAAGRMSTNASVAESRSTSNSKS